MKLKLTESFWKHRVYSEAKKLRRVVTLFRYEEIKDAVLALYNKLMSFYQEKNDEPIREEINELKAEWENFNLNDYATDLKDTYNNEELDEQINTLLDKLYDFCDKERIWLGL